MGNLAATPPTPRVPVAAAILAQATILANLSEGVAERTQSRLLDVMREVPPSEAPETDASAYPKYFDDLRSQLWRIETSLNRIDRFVDRTEL